MNVLLYLRFDKALREPFLRAIFGTLMLLLIVRWSEPLFFGSGYYAGLSVHPFWIIVILAAAQRGLFVGVTTAALAGLLMEWPARMVDADISTYYAELAIMPVQWILSAVLIGAFRQMQIAEESRLRLENRRLRDDNALIAEEVSRLDKVVFDLELASATRTTDGGAALKALAELGRCPPHQIATRLEAAAKLLTRRPGRVQVALPQDGKATYRWGQAAAITSQKMPFPGDPPKVVTLIGRNGDMHFAACAAVRGAGAPGWVAIIAKDAAGAAAECGVSAVLAQALESAITNTSVNPEAMRVRHRTTS